MLNDSLTITIILNSAMPPGALIHIIDTHMRPSGVNDYNMCELHGIVEQPREYKIKL